MIPLQAATAHRVEAEVVSSESMSFKHLVAYLGLQHMESFWMGLGNRNG